MINLKWKKLSFFVKVPRPDGKEDFLGLTVLDEPSSKQSDPHVLGLKMRYTSNQPVATSLPSVRNIIDELHCYFVLI